jgi:hypothetical protein
MYLHCFWYNSSNRIDWKTTLIFASEWLSGNKILVNICRRKAVSGNGYTASIAHSWAPAVYHQFSLKSMVQNRGIHLPTSLLVWAEWFSFYGVTVRILARSLKRHAITFGSSVYTLLPRVCTESCVYIKDVYKFGLNFIVWVHFFAFVQSNKLGVVCMFITGQQVAKFPCNTPLNWCLVNMLDNALHLVSERGSPIVFVSYTQSL